MKLETCFPRLLKDTYVIHRNGGFHPFKDVAEAAPIFKQDCWPFIQRIHWPKTHHLLKEKKEWRQETPRPKQMNLGVSMMHCYPFINLMEPNKVMKKAKNRPPRLTNRSYYLLMHRAVAGAFVPNPEKKPQVCHINDDPMDYRVENLRWGTNKENHTGRRGDRKKDYDHIHTIFKMNGWARG
jgi:hypothetical protein